MKGKWLVVITGTNCKFEGNERSCSKAQYEAMACLNDIAWGCDKETISRFIGYASKNHKQTIRYTFKLN